MSAFQSMLASLVLWDRPGVPLWKRRRFWVRERQEPGPRFIYKFRALPPPGDAKWSMLRDLIVGHKIWMAAPDTFSDPIDSHVHFAFTAKSAGERRHELERYLRRAGNLTSAGFRKWAAAQHVDITGMVADPRKLNALFERIVALHKGAAGVCSFCEVVDQRTVWDGYADGHRGIALQFEPWRDPSAFLGYPMRYTDDPPVVTDWMTNRDHRRLLNVHLRKAPEYMHEREYRVFEPEHANVHRVYRPESLSGVVFGMRTAEPERQEVLGLLDERVKTTGDHPRLYQASLDGKTGRLKFLRYVR